MTESLTIDQKTCATVDKPSVDSLISRSDSSICNESPLTDESSSRVQKSPSFEDATDDVTPEGHTTKSDHVSVIDNASGSECAESDKTQSTSSENALQGDSPSVSSTKDISSEDSPNNKLKSITDLRSDQSPDITSDAEGEKSGNLNNESASAEDSSSTRDQASPLSEETSGTKENSPGATRISDQSPSLLYTTCDQPIESRNENSETSSVADILRGDQQESLQPHATSSIDNTSAEARNDKEESLSKKDPAPEQSHSSDTHKLSGGTTGAQAVQTPTYSSANTSRNADEEPGDDSSSRGTAPQSESGMVSCQ